MVVMRNVFSGFLKIHKKYDLKGSTVDREASDKERIKDCPTFKVRIIIRLICIDHTSDVSSLD